MKAPVVKLNVPKSSCWSVPIPVAYNAPDEANATENPPDSLYGAYGNGVLRIPIWVNAPVVGIDASPGAAAQRRTRKACHLARTSASQSPR